jgi:para-nitrobenzyl esterase
MTSEQLQPSAVVDTAQGKVQGYVFRGISIYRGLPYGAPTDGANRFLPPQPAVPWTGVRHALHYGQTAPQAPGPLAEGGTPDDRPAMGEDCLCLNVWTKAADRERRPVMVWLHGGGFEAGSGSSMLYDATNLARRGDIVGASINHRLGIFGHCHLADVGGTDFAGSANAGFLDVVQALRWVRDNIERFGGDPGNVTLFGESAGGMAVVALMGMPAAQGLFHRAISQSGAATFSTKPAQAAELASRLMSRLGVSDVEGLWSSSAEEIVAAHELVGADLGLRSGLGPVADGTTLPDQLGVLIAEGKVARVPFIVGTNRDEMNLFNAPRLKDVNEPIEEDEAARIVRLFLPSLSLERAHAVLSAYRSSRSAEGLPSGTRKMMSP